MSTTDLKNKLKKKIDELNQDDLLEQLLGIIELESIKSQVFKIPEIHKEGIEEGLLQIKEGKTNSHDEVVSKYNSWG